MCPLCSILFTEDQFQTQISTVDLDLMSNKSSVSIGDRRKRCAFLKKIPCCFQTNLLLMLLTIWKLFLLYKEKNSVIRRKNEIITTFEVHLAYSIHRSLIHDSLIHSKSVFSLF